jgi:hypothetical protein
LGDEKLPADWRQIEFTKGVGVVETVNSGVGVLVIVGVLVMVLVFVKVDVTVKVGV